MLSSKLEMTFKNQLDTKSTISVENPRPDLTEAEVNTFMSDIITKNIFNSSGGDLIAISGARIVTTDVTELSL